MSLDVPSRLLSVEVHPLPSGDQAFAHAVDDAVAYFEPDRLDPDALESVLRRRYGRISVRPQHPLS